MSVEKKWHEVLPNGTPYAVTLYSPTNDVEQTLCDANGKRADHVLCGSAVTVAAGDESGNLLEPGVRFGFLILGDRDAVLARGLYEEQAVMSAVQLIDNFYGAMRDIFGVNAIKMAGEILCDIEQEKRKALLEFIGQRQFN